jgi:serine/threonine protein kinase
VELGKWRCPACGAENDAFARFCTSCGSERPGLWRCSKGHANLPFFEYCTACGEPRKVEEFLSILNVEAPTLSAGEWGKIAVRVKGFGKVSLTVEGDVEYVSPEPVELSGESIIEVSVKPKGIGDVPVKVTVESSGKRESKTVLLKVKEPPLPSFEVLRERYIGKAVDVELPIVTPIERPNISIHGYECRSTLALTEISATLLGVDENGYSHVLKIPVKSYLQKTHGARIVKPSQFKRFGKEVEFLRHVAGLNHPCIVKFEKALEAYGDDPPALVFEFCEGGSLADLLEKYGKLNPVTAVKIIVQVADALAAIHELGYAHGDVKPENILFSRDRIPRLADFNSARAVAVVSDSEVPLTYGYAAPEQLDTRRPSQKGDVWSLALVLYEAVTGRSLFPFDEIEYKNAIAQLKRGRKVEVRTGDSDLDAIIEKCIKANPDERPSMRELEKILFAYLEKKIKKT